MSDVATPIPPTERNHDQDERELVGRNIARARVAAGLTQDQLAAQLGVARPQLSMWERGRRLPNARYRWAIAGALGHDTDLGWLYSREDGAT